MKRTPPLKRVLSYLLFFSLFLSASAVAGDPLITGSFSGIWEQPEQESQGMIFRLVSRLMTKRSASPTGSPMDQTFQPHGISVLGRSRVTK